MHLFFADEPITDQGKLGKEESHHAARVLRLNTGDKILVTAGQGTIYLAEVAAMQKFELLYRITGIYSSEERKNYLHIAIAPTKSLDRFEFFLEKATEAGVDEITPIISFHSERKVYKRERGEKIIRSAAKQSLSNWLPRLNQTVSFADFIKERPEGERCIAHCEKDQERTNILEQLSTYKKITMLIGPEGDFSPVEIKQALESSYRAVSLGPKRLRTETAGIAVALATKLLECNPHL